MARYSHSKLSTFEQCKYKYKLQYIDGVKREEGASSVEAFLGSKVHEVFEKLYKDLKFQKKNSLKDLLKFYNTVWDKEWTDDIVINKDYSADNYRKMGEKFISDYYNHYSPFDQMTVLGIETQDLLHLSSDVHYSVRIDRLCCKGDTYYICDYKTNSHMKDQEEADSDRQLAMYSLFVKDRFKDAKKIVLLWHMLAFDKEVVSERSSKELSKLKEETLKLISSIEKCKEFPTTVSALCNYCGYKSQCPAFKHALVLSEKSVKEFKKDSGVKLVDELSALKIKKKEIEDRMDVVINDVIAFAKSCGVSIVYGSNKKASVKETWKVIYPEDKEAFVRLMKKKGLFSEFSSICYQKLSSAILKEEIKDKEILKSIKKEKDYRVNVGKKNEIV